MVVLLVQYNVRPEKSIEYQTWVNAQVPIAMKAPGIVDLKAYNSIAGEHEVTALDYFEDLAGFATWRANEGVMKIFAELWQYAENVRTELLISESKPA